ncbi:hypothetical protein QSJ18_04970 [Gordonia sp. ABSL1-1]|uniref:hypothetical protein n=1 Tax=Gordonia sp. ABSL1-1 TaxID=3053923 RepID=UPI0025737ABE|nr:hypothetical protein [Gordonia sp. ABSL1-1]MDL9936084.1 hypothetical protein [Gordonia sp. ABSL1-1]
MTYLLAAIGVIAVTFLLWRAFGPQHDSSSASPSRNSRNRGPSGPVGPDDDPDFLRDLDNRTRGPNGTDSDES